MDNELLHEVSGMLLDLELATTDYAGCRKPDEERYNDIVEEKEDALIALIDNLINTNAKKLSKTKRKIARCKERCDNLSADVECLEGVIKLLTNNLCDANKKLDVARTTTTLLSPILSVWEEDDSEWCAEGYNA